MPSRIESHQEELLRRHRGAALVVSSLILMTVVLAVVAYISTKFIPQQPNPSLDITWRIIIPILGLGAVALRRTKFGAMRLQDIAGLRGISALLVALQRTTVQVALLGGGIAILGFIIALKTGIYFYMLGAGVVALAVLFYSYPRRRAWQRVTEGIEQKGDANDPLPDTSSAQEE
jgi:carbon starvation protein CstA